MFQCFCVFVNAHLFVRYSDDPGELYLEKGDDEDGHLSDTSVMSAGKTQKRYDPVAIMKRCFVTS